MTGLSSLHVLVVDDDADTRGNLADILSMDDYQVDTAGTVAQTLARDNWQEIDAIILDRKLPDGSAEDLLPRLRQLAPHAAIIIVTGYADLEGAIAAIRQGAADYLLKPINLDLLRTRLAGIAERKRAEAEIARLNQDLQRRMSDMQTLLDVIPIGIAIAEDSQCERTYINKFLARQLHLPADVNVSLSGPSPQVPLFGIFRRGKEVSAAEFPLRVAAARGVEVRNAEFDFVLPDETVVNVFSHAAPLLDESGKSRGAVGVYLDVTEQKKAQERHLQTERLAAIGQMMTGLAHESGNALARSQVCLEMLGMQVEDRPKARELVDRVQNAQDHLQHLYEEVRGYAAPLHLDRENVSLASIWRQAWGNLEVVRKGRVASLREEAEGVDLRGDFDSFRLQQVFRNILENALAACKDPVEIAVVCGETRLKGRPAIRIAVRDNGPGLSAEQRQRIFDPFFTTKTKGTGLGMAISKRIVEAHGGQIAAGAGPADGAEILLTLPRESL